MNEVVCVAFYKGFEEYKRKVMQAFHLPDLRDIIADEPKEVEGGVDTTTRDEPIKAGEAAEAEADPNPLRALTRQSCQIDRPNGLNAGDCHVDDSQDGGDDRCYRGGHPDWWGPNSKL